MTDESGDIDIAEFLAWFDMPVVNPQRKVGLSGVGAMDLFGLLGLLGLLGLSEVGLSPGSALRNTRIARITLSYQRLAALITRSSCLHHPFGSGSRGPARAVCYRLLATRITRTVIILITRQTLIITSLTTLHNHL